MRRPYVRFALFRTKRPRWETLVNDVYAGGHMAPGLRRWSGSNACLSARMASSVGGVMARAVNPRLTRPSPCSPDSTPPAASPTSAMTPSMAAAASRSVGSLGS